MYEQAISGQLILLRYNVRTWLFAVGYKRLLQYRRKTKRLFGGDAVDRALTKFDTDFDVWSDYPGETKQQEAEAAMHLLSPHCKEILSLRFYEGQNIADIKLALDLNSDNTVSATLSRCLRRLKSIIEQRNILLKNTKHTPIL